MSRKIVYDKQPCTRCGGTGHYSYNSRTGTICFKCNGAKETLTKKGVAAKAAVDALKVDLCTILAKDVTMGMRVTLPGERKPSPVKEIQPAGTTANRSKIGDGPWVDCLVIVANSRHGGDTHFSLTPDAQLTRFPNLDEWDKIFALAATLPGCTVIGTDSAAEVSK